MVNPGHDLLYKLEVNITLGFFEPETLNLELEIKKE